MSLRVVQSWSNGTLAREAQAFAANFSEVLSIQPRNMAGDHLDRQGKQPGRAGSLGIRRTTLLQLALELARPVMAERGLAPLSALGSEALATQAAFAAQQEGRLRYFQPVASLPGFGRVLARTLSELRLAGVRPDQLAGRGPSPGDLAVLLEAYELALTDGALVDQAGILELAGGVVAAVPDSGPTALETQSGNWQGGRARAAGVGLPLVLLASPLPSALHRALFRTIAGRAPDVLVAVNKQDADAAELLNVEPEELDGPQASPLELGAETDSIQNELEHLRANLFVQSPRPFAARPTSNGNSEKESARFEYFSSPGEGLETVEIARRILRLAGQGIPFDDMAILLRNPERYQPMLEDALRRARIPVYFSRGTRRPDPAGRAFLALLGCKASNLAASRFAEYLSLGQVPSQTPPSQTSGEDSEWVGPEDEILAAPRDPIEPDEATPEQTGEAEDLAEESVDPDSPVAAGTLRAPWGWERMLVDAAVIGGKDRWERRLEGLEREWEFQLASDEAAPPAEYGRDGKVSGPRLRLDQLRNLRHFALPLIQALDELPANAIWGEWVDGLATLARRALKDPEGVLAMLAELAPMSAVGPVGLAEVIEVLGERLRFLRREPPVRRWGQVYVGSLDHGADEVRGREFPVVFLPGLAEGLFPQRALEDPLLLDEFRREIDPDLKLRDDAVHEERLRLHLAVAAARDRLIASYPRMEVAEARPRVPSFYALELPRAIAGTLPPLREFEDHARKAAPARLNWPAPGEAADAIDDAEFDLVAIAKGRNQAGAAHYLVDANPHLIRSLRARWIRWHAKWQPADGLIVQSAEGMGPQVLDALATQRLTARSWSPSSLELFAVCPYRFALHGILRLRPREDSEALQQMDPRTRGSLFHEIQNRLFVDLQGAELLPVTPGRLQDALARCDTTLDEVAREFSEQLAPAIPRVWDAEIADLRTDLRGWLHHVAHNDDEWTPVEFERSFGSPGSDDEPEADFLLAEGARLHGRIDLVERNPARGTVRVTDHKTGKRPDQVPRWVGGGKSLQPLLYGIAAEKLLDTPVEAGRLLYATQKGGYTPIEMKIDKRARLFLSHLLGRIDGAIADGFLPPFPEKDACGHCDYRIACGPYEELRTRKKDRRDERLEGLIEIRGMA